VGVAGRSIISGRPGRTLRPAAFASILAVTAAAGADAQVRANYEDGIVEIVVDRLPPLTLVVLVDSAGGMLLPVTQIAAHVGLPATSSGNTLAFPRLDGSRTSLDTAAGTITWAGVTVGLAPAEIVVDDGEVFLRAERLQLILEATINVDFASLNVVLQRNVPFPAQQRIIAEQRRAMLLAQQSRRAVRAADDSVAFPFTTVLGVLDWEVASSGLDPRRLTTIRTQAGAAVLGGDMLATATFEVGRDAASATRDMTARYHRVFGSPALRQVRAGSIISSGLFGRFLTGVELTNRPFLRPEELGEVLVSPDLPPGWEYEVFQGAQLLGWSDAIVRDPVSVPLRSGGTPVQVRMYGPAGEEVVSTLLYQTPVSLLGRHVLEYTAGAGTCDGSTCDRFAHADVRFGATSFLTLGGGAEYIADSLTTRVRPYAVASFTTGLRATAELQLMPGALYGSTVTLYPRDRATALLRTTVSRPGFGPISLIPDSRSRWDVEGSWEERLRGEGALRSLRFSAAAGGSAATGPQRWRAATTGGLRRGYVELRYDNDRLAQRPHLLTGRGGILTPLRIGRRTVRPLFSGAAGFGELGVQLAELGASFQPGPASVLSASLLWSRGYPRPAAQLSFSTRIGSVQTSTRVVRSPRSGGTSATSLSGSAAFAPDGSITTFPIARTGYGGFYGTVFIDHDGDGSFSPGDSPIPGAHITAGDLRATANDDGRFRVWGVLPFTAVSVAIDSTRIADPGWTSASPAVRLRAAPNAARRIDIPLVQTRELIGSLTADDGGPTIAGISLIIHNLATADSTSTVTFSDGQFYVSRLRPGSYRIAVSPASLDAIRADASPAFLDFELPVSDDPLFELPPIHLQPRRSP
jgi:hypothetical protein